MLVEECSVPYDILSLFSWCLPSFASFRVLCPLFVVYSIQCRSLILLPVFPFDASSCSLISEAFIFFVVCRVMLLIQLQCRFLYCRLSVLMSFVFFGFVQSFNCGLLFFLSLILLLFSVFVNSLYILTPPKQQTNPNGLIFRYA